MLDESLPTKPAVDAPVLIPKGKGARKARRAPAPRRLRGKLRLKPKVLARAQKRPPAGEGAVPMGPAEPGSDQTGRKPIARAPEGYVRFRVRVEDGEMTVVDSHLVESTLVQQSAVHGNFVYEITEGEKRLHLDSIPDLGVFRSFANPDGPPEQRRHHIYELSTYEFDVRVPVKELASAALPRVAIALYRVKDARPPMTAGVMPLSAQYQRELREVARLEGIPIQVLPEVLRKARVARGRKRTTKTKRKK
jgi:hypothetical protein